MAGYDPMREIIERDKKKYMDERNAAEQVAMQQNIDAYNDSVNNNLVANSASTANSLMSKEELAKERSKNLGLGNSGFAGAMNKGMAVAGGVMNLYNTFNDLSKIGDTSAYWGEINDINALGTKDYSDYYDLGADYSNLDSLQPDIDYMKIRGKSDGERAAGIGSAMLQGASAGMAFGPYGAAAGAAIGLGTGIAGVIAGNSKARFEKLRLTNAAAMANSNARSNLEVASEGLADYKFRSGVANRADWGGPIERKQQSIKEFAANALKKPQMREHGPSKRFVRSHRDGGTVVKIKR